MEVLIVLFTHVMCAVRKDVDVMLLSVLSCVQNVKDILYIFMCFILVYFLYSCMLHWLVVFPRCWSSYVVKWFVYVDIMSNYERSV
jgi:hypothetical protein